MELQEPFITISALPGAGGRELARSIVAELELRGQPGWQALDDEIAKRVVRDSRLNVPLDELLREEYRNDFEDFVAQFIERSSPQSEITDRVFSVVRGAAQKGRAVIVGRAAVCVTRGMPLGLHLRLVACEKTRQDRAIKLGLAAEQAREELERRAAWRAALMWRRFRRRIDDPLLYDAVLNADRFSMERLARVSADLLEERLERMRQRGTMSL